MTEDADHPPRLAAGRGARRRRSWPRRAIVRAAPAPVNVAFFVVTRPFMIAKGEGWIEEAAGGKVNWIEVGSGAEINTAIAAGSMDIGFGIGSSPTAAGISQGIRTKSSP